MNSNKITVIATAITVFAVAAIAFTQSYLHIYSLGVHHGQIGASGPLLPLSVDGLIIATSLVLLIVSWQRLSVPWLARLFLWLGIGATIAANIGYGWAWGPIGILTSVWPPLAFVGCAEVCLQLGKIKRRQPEKDEERRRLNEMMNLDAPLTGWQVMTGRPERNPGDMDVAKMRLDWAAAQHGPVEVMPEYSDPPSKVPTNGELKASAYKKITGKLPSIKSIREELHCGQPRATKLQGYMRATGCDLEKALLMEAEEK